MTLQQAAYNKINMLSDNDLKILLIFADELIEKQNIKNEKDVDKKISAFNELLEIRAKNPLPADFDFDKAREEALEEKYGSFT